MWAIQLLFQDPGQQGPAGGLQLCSACPQPQHPSWQEAVAQHLLAGTGAPVLSCLGVVPVNLDKDTLQSSSMPGRDSMDESYSLAVDPLGVLQEAVAKECAALRWGDFKPRLAESIVDHLAPVQRRYEEVTRDPAVLEQVGPVTSQLCVMPTGSSHLPCCAGCVQQAASPCSTSSCDPELVVAKCAAG